MASEKHAPHGNADLGERINNAFEEFSARNTGPRRAIAGKLTEFAQDGLTFTVDDLWQGLKSVHPGIGRATVFRSVEKLVELEVLDRIDFADGARRYRACDASGRHHHHLACTQCHRVMEFSYCMPDRQIEEIGKQENFSVEGHSLTIYGRCEACREHEGS